MEIMRAVFGLLLLCCLCQRAIASNEELIETLKMVRGIYEDADKAKSLGIENAVLVTACNFGFVNHLFNFDCFMRRLKLKYLVFAMDKQAYDFIKKNTKIPVVLTDNELASTSQEFRSKHFNLITAKKKEVVRDIMQLGYDVLFSDTDVAVVQDPLPYMIWKNVDYVHSLNSWCDGKDHSDFFQKSKTEGNTGFYFVRSNVRTMKLWNDVLFAAPKHPRLDDQAVFWKVLRQSQDPPPLAIQRCRDYTGGSALVDSTTGKHFIVNCVLDSCMFSAGMISRKYEPEFTIETLLEHLNNQNKSIVTLHANYMSGNQKKAQAMKDFGFWLADIQSDMSYTCKDYVPFVPAPSTT